MKSTNLILAFTLLISTLNLFAQKDLHSQLMEIGEGQVYKAYWGISKTDGKYSGEAFSTKYKIKFEQDIVGNLSAFKGIKEEGTDEKTNSGFGWLKPNHYTKPSMYWSDRHAMGYVFIDGLIYCLEDVKDPLNVTDFTIDEIWVPVLAPGTKGEEETKSEEPKKKVSMKEKMANLKKSLAEASGGTPKEIADKDHEAIIKKYLNDMVAIQKEATANFTDKNKSDIDAVEKGDEAYAAEVKKKNAEFWNSEHGQKVLGEMQQEDITIYNDLGFEALLRYGSNISVFLEPGESLKVSCSHSHVKKGERIPNNSTQLNATSQTILRTEGKNCGTTYNLSTLNY